jgi:endonuclease YncB( thermonuclease family)
MRSLYKVVLVFVSVASALIEAQGALASTPQTAAPSPVVVQGSARALDGDTLDVTTPRGVVRVRLEGIDAAEGGQRCNLRWLGTWDCGRAASLALAQLIDNKIVSCDDRGADKYGRRLGVCAVEGRDLNAAMVRGGLAWAFTRYSDLYVAQEAEARKARLGVWQAATMTPWDWRAQQKLPVARKDEAARPLPFVAPRRGDDVAAAVPAPAGCAIKGNITKNGRIYHTAASPWYDRIRMDLGLGRRWFCTEAEAQEAGWRPAGAATAQ